MQADSDIEPEALKTRPTLDERWNPALIVWRKLNGSRPPATEGMAEVPFSEVFMYGFACGLDRAEICALWEDFNKIDSMWVTLAIEKAKASAQAAAQK